MGCQSFTTGTPLPPRSSSQTSCTPSRSMPLWPRSEWWGGVSGRHGSSSPVRGQWASSDVPTPLPSSLAFLLASCVTPVPASLAHPFHGSFSVACGTQTLPILKKYFLNSGLFVPLSCHLLSLHSPEKCLCSRSCSAVLFASNFCSCTSLVSPTSLMGSPWAQ